MRNNYHKDKKNIVETVKDLRAHKIKPVLVSQNTGTSTSILKKNAKMPFNAIIDNFAYRVNPLTPR